MSVLIEECCVSGWTYIWKRASGGATQNTNRSECMEKRSGGIPVMMGRTISRQLNGKVLDSCVVPASRPTYGLETLALPELHQR